ncbi:MAG: hypothetical protein ISR58_07595 [Anaerolineales bacterium]|nr:hypothetical protein [Chloroflexota bacterium]MBL6981040.1 hypothetical protein [Anaerolineales bacterium]
MSEDVVDGVGDLDGVTDSVGVSEEVMVGEAKKSDVGVGVFVHVTEAYGVAVFVECEVTEAVNDGVAVS